MVSNDGADEMQQLLKLTEEAVSNNEAISKSDKSAPHTNTEKRDGRTHAIPKGAYSTTIGKRKQAGYKKYN